MDYVVRNNGEPEKNIIETEDMIKNSNISKEEIPYNINEINNNKNSYFPLIEKREKKIIFHLAPANKNDLKIKHSTKNKHSDNYYQNDVEYVRDSKLLNNKVKVKKRKKEDKTSQNKNENESGKNTRCDKNQNEHNEVITECYNVGQYKKGRWQPDEHIRFIEAILQYGNQWNKVQKHVRSRTSTQARSHAQKFFVKIKRTNLINFSIDLNKNSIKNLHEAANSLNGEEYLKTIKTLNKVAFEKKSIPSSGNFHDLNKEKNMNTSSTDLLKNVNDSLIKQNNKIICNSNLEQMKIEQNNSNSILKSDEEKIKFPTNELNNTAIKSSNVKILSFSEIKRDDDINIKSSYSKPINSDSNKNIIINNNFNNYNIHLNSNNNEVNNMRNLNTKSSNFLNNNVKIRKRPRIDSLENIFNNNLYDTINTNSAVPKFKIEEEFYNAFYNSHHDFSIDDNINIHSNSQMNPFSLENYLNYSNYNNTLHLKNEVEKSNDINKLEF